MTADRFRIEQLRRRVDINPASIAFAALAEEYRRAGFFDEAIETCSRGLLRHPSYLAARMTLATTLLEAGRLDEAQIEFERVLLSAPESVPAIRGLARVEGIRSGELKPASRQRAEERQVEALGGLLAAIHQARSGLRASR